MKAPRGLFCLEKRMQTIPGRLVDRIALAEANRGALVAKADGLTIKLRDALVEGAPPHKIAQQRRNICEVKEQIDQYDLLLAELRARQPVEELNEVPAEAIVAHRPEYLTRGDAEALIDECVIMRVAEAIVGVGLGDVFLKETQ
jgi:hypothetical protein